MSTLAIIPARGGSKGIPRKNLQLVGGLPLVAHSIRHAREAPSIERVIVSTDDSEIAAVAIANGAEVVDRPVGISGDNASSESALLHVLDQLEARNRWLPDVVVFLQATSPLRPPGAVQAAIDQFLAEGADSLFSSVPQHGFVWRARGNDLESVTYDYHHRQRRQDAGTDLVENGSIYIFRPWVLRQLGNRLGGRITTYVMDPLYIFQIDEPGDLQLAEHLSSIVSSGTKPAISSVRLLALDFDGVLTDNRVVITQDGREAVACSRADGFGIQRLREAGIEIVVISKEANPVVQERCRKLGVPCIHNCNDKLGALMSYAAQAQIARSEVAFVGNDLPDLDCLQWAGVPIVVSDCDPSVRHAGTLMTTRPGGHGAVREVADWILACGHAPRRPSGVGAASAV